MNEILAWLVPILCTALVGTVAWVIRLEVRLTRGDGKMDALTLAITTLSETLQAHIHDNKTEHDSFYNFGTKTEGVLIELSTLFKGMKEKQDSMDGKIDTLLNRRASPR